jgi:hypothetical protein
MSRDQYNTAPPVFPREEARANEAFMRIACKWFNTDERTVRDWLGRSDLAGTLIGNLRSVFTAGYVLGLREGDQL